MLASQTGAAWADYSSPELFARTHSILQIFPLFHLASLLEARGPPRPTWCVAFLPSRGQFLDTPSFLPNGSQLYQRPLSDYPSPLLPWPTKASLPTSYRSLNLHSAESTSMSLCGAWASSSSGSSSLLQQLNWPKSGAVSADTFKWCSNLSPISSVRLKSPYLIFCCSDAGTSREILEAGIFCYCRSTQDLLTIFHRLIPSKPNSHVSVSYF